MSCPVCFFIDCVAVFWTTQSLPCLGSYIGILVPRSWCGNDLGIIWEELVNWFLSETGLVSKRKCRKTFREGHRKTRSEGKAATQIKRDKWRVLRDGSGDVPKAKHETEWREHVSEQTCPSAGLCSVCCTFPPPKMHGRHWSWVLPKSQSWALMHGRHWRWVFISILILIACFSITSPTQSSPHTPPIPCISHTHKYKNSKNSSVYPCSFPH